MKAKNLLKVLSVLLCTIYCASCNKANNNEEFLLKLDKIINSDNKEIINNGYLVAKSKNLDIIGKELKLAYENLYQKFYKNN